MAQKLLRKVFLATERLSEMIEEIKNERGYTDNTMVYYTAITDLYKRVKPGYVEYRKTTTARTPEEKADLQIDVQKRIKDREEKILLDIAEKLGAKIVKGDGGGKVVMYYMYDRNNRYLQEVPLSMMTEELVDNQYFPSREDVEDRQKKLKVNYTPGTWEK